MGAIQQSVLSMLGSAGQAAGFSKMIKGQTQSNKMQQVRNNAEAVSYKMRAAQLEQENKDLEAESKFQQHENSTPDDRQQYADLLELGEDPMDHMDPNTVKAIESLNRMEDKRNLNKDQMEAYNDLYDALKSKDKDLQFEVNIPTSMKGGK